MRNETDLLCWFEMAADRAGPFKTHALCTGRKTEAEMRTISFSGTILGGIDQVETVGHLWRRCKVPVPVLAGMVCSVDVQTDPLAHAQTVLTSFINQLQTVAA